ncbi:arginase family protein, partial [Virgibacillus salexigens]|uniref:arginase family protein n=1 Tax=Virgibacillus salexigens TaxID=61016 RepID=UPI003082081E
LSHYQIADLVDVGVVPADTIETMRRIEQFASSVCDSKGFPVAFGGDHGITYPIVKALSEQVDGQVGIFHLDAHYDNYKDYDGDLYARSTPFHRIYESE